MELDNQSIASSSQTKTSKKSNPKEDKKSSKKKSDETLEAKNFKKIKKVLKDALQHEKEKTTALDSELEKLKTKSSAQELEIKDKEQKYLDLYMENTHQHEQLVQLQNQVMLLESSPLRDKAPKEKNRLRDDSDMIMGYEKRIQEYLMNIQKLERDLSYKEEELKNMKNIARDAAAELEPMRKLEQEFLKQLADKDA